MHFIYSFFNYVCFYKHILYVSYIQFIIFTKTSQFILPLHFKSSTFPFFVSVFYCLFLRLEEDIEFHRTVSSVFTASGMQELHAAGLTHVHLLPTYDYGSVPEKEADQETPAVGPSILKDCFSCPPFPDQMVKKSINAVPAPFPTTKVQT
jgi:hypothetical protein